MPNRTKSLLLVLLQFIFIYLLGTSITFENISLLAFAFIFLSILLLAWSIMTMRKSRLNILPDPHTNAILISNGPYRFIRHPMYTAILLGSSGLLFSQFTWFRLLIVLALAIVLVVKLTWEEKMLSHKFENYKQYRKQTYRLIPFIY
jgi:protein-S-isoprenylcysteine O-methyltransferase Ste14